MMLLRPTVLDTTQSIIPFDGRPSTPLEPYPARHHRDIFIHSFRGYHRRFIGSLPLRTDRTGDRLYHGQKTIRDCSIVPCIKCKLIE